MFPSVFHLCPSVAKILFSLYRVNYIEVRRVRVDRLTCLFLRINLAQSRESMLRQFRRRFALILICCLAWSIPGRQLFAADDDEFFEKRVRPILAGTCFRCHGGDKVGGGLRVDSREALLKGGDTGASFVPGQPDESLLIQAIRRLDDVPHMPPDKPLPRESVEALVTWIKAGAKWPDKVVAFKSVRHWSFEPLRNVTAPAETPVGPPIDQLVSSKLRDLGLTAAPRADRKTLLRRATFDLTGLPPTPEELQDFLRDQSPEAFAKVIDRLLDSPSYGERWGRHWLDLVRYADTAGETADFPVPQAWRYRNYVIDAFNRDKPYDEFLREQIAGDILAQRLPPDASKERYRELIVATGYLGVARRFGFDVLHDHFLTIEDTIDTVGKSILGVTIACARCHDHKFDPFTVNDYYGLYGIFESTRYPFPGCEKTKSPRDMVPLMPPNEMRQAMASLDGEIQACDARKAEADKHVLEVAGRAAGTTVAGDIPNGGRQDFSAAENAAGFEKLTVKKGEMLQLSVLPKNGHGADSTLVELVIIELEGDRRVWNLSQQVLPDVYDNGQGMQHRDAYGHTGVWNFFDLVPAPTLMTQFLKDAEKTPGLQIWRGAEDTPSIMFNTNDRDIKFITVAQPAKSLALHPGPRGGVAVAWQSPIDGVVSVSGRVQDIDPTGGDGIAWKLELRSGYATELAAAKEFTVASSAAREKRNQFEQKVDKAYAVVEGEPHDAQIHKRGDPETRGDPTPRSFPKALGGQNLPPNSGSGRLQLADWLASPQNPLTARVMVNRIWQQHFGRGLVNTPNDFGTRGELPSHPELLDDLARRFMAGGWSVKSMHRLIMLTDAYHRDSNAETLGAALEANLRIDPANAYLWRFTRRRLSAEEIRDAVLACSGSLDRTPGGPHPFPDEKGWGFTQHTPFAALYDTDRRSVYLMTQRIKRHPFLTLFDGADANTSTPQRFQTIVPTQALFFMNDPFVHDKAQHFAKQLAPLATDEARLDRAYQLLFSRPPSATEQASAARFLNGYQADLAQDSTPQTSAWAAYLRVLMSSNEFVFVD